jgi:hypothetical protein
MKQLKRIIIWTAMSLLPLAILSAQNSAESQLNKNSSISNRTIYINITEFSYGIGFGDSHGHSSFGIHTINGCLFNSALSIGLGIGLDRLHIDKNLSETILPISLDIRLNFVKDPKILFLDIEGGYTYNLSGNKLGYRDGLGGFFIDPSIGAKIFSYNKISIIICLGIKIQETTINYVNMVLPKNEILINLKAGFKF